MRKMRNVFQVQDKFVLQLTDEEAVAYLQNLIDESVSAIMAALVEQFHKMAQVCMSSNSCHQASTHFVW